MANKIYWERQKKDLCRMHSINAFMGKKVINEALFNKYCKEYNQYIKIKFNDVINTRIFNIFYWKDLTEFIIQKYQPIYFNHIPITKVKKYLVDNKFRNILQAFEKSKRALLYNKNHIYALRKVDNQWYTIDSLRGVRKINLGRVNFRGIGILLAHDKKDSWIWEFKRLQLQIFKFLKNENINPDNQKSCEKWIEKNYSKRLLDDLEIYFNSLSKLKDCLKFNMKFLDEFMTHYHHKKLEISFFKRYFYVVLNKIMSIKV